MSGSFTQLHYVPVFAPNYPDTGSFPATGNAGQLAYSVADALVYVFNGSTWAALEVGAQEVSAASAYANDNRLLRSDGVDRSTQASTVVLTDAGALSGITNISLTGTVDGRDVSDDGATLDTTVATVSTALLDADFGANGVMVRTAAGAYTNRTIAGTANQVTVTNGDGVAGAPTLALPQNIHTAAAPTFAALTLSANQFLTGIVLEIVTNGGTTAISATTAVEIIVPDSVTVAAHTLTLPASPANGQVLYIANGTDGNTITALILNPGAKGITNPLTALGATPAGFIYHAATTTWYRFA